MIFSSQPRGALHHGVGLEDAAVTKFYFISHDGVGADFYSTTQPRRWRNDGAGINLTHRAFSTASCATPGAESRSTILQSSSASAASSPFTEARQPNLQMD